MLATITVNGTSFSVNPESAVRVFADIADRIESGESRRLVIQGDDLIGGYSILVFLLTPTSTASMEITSESVSELPTSVLNLLS